MMKPFIEQITDKMILEYEDNIVKAVQNIGINLDKERLAKALIDSRSFYDEGYADAKAKYEKALDKACEELESYDYQANLKPYQYDTDDYTTSKEWKAWCLDEDR